MFPSKASFVVLAACAAFTGCHYTERGTLAELDPTKLVIERVPESTGPVTIRLYPRARDGCVGLDANVRLRANGREGRLSFAGGANSTRGGDVCTAAVFEIEESALVPTSADGTTLVEVVDASRTIRFEVREPTRSRELVPRRALAEIAPGESFIVDWTPASDTLGDGHVEALLTRGGGGRNVPLASRLEEKAIVLTVPTEAEPGSYTLSVDHFAEPEVIRCEGVESCSMLQSGKLSQPLRVR